jgi:transposase
MEAYEGAHYWARRFREHGHCVKLMASQSVKPYGKSNTHDMADAEPQGELHTVLRRQASIRKCSGG